ncbi:uncharacterized protein LOC111015611 [Momordica charantia]|uniref:Uncharacterized protein LOC111015611 n=1 Tax=Momordica charantia TaxID=3673 RepID=A0A6J1CYF6_MOMCH|nr:uncharacterized protein LOC111015611 [Momordica charantia]
MNLFCGLNRNQAKMGNKNTTFLSPTTDAESPLVLRSIRDEKPLHYTLKIKSFSLLKKALASSKRDRFVSQIFHASGYKWKLALYPNGDKNRNGSGYISLYLVTAEDEIVSATSEVNVVLTFLVYDSLRDKYLAIQDGKVKRFHRMKTEWGFEKLISFDIFNNPSNGFLVGGYAAFGVDIFVIKSDDGGKGEILSLINPPEHYKFTWKINHFSTQSKTLSSDVFSVEGYHWRVELHPNGCPTAMSNYLSLFLIFDDLRELPDDSQVYVEYEMAVLSQVGDKHWFEYGGGDGWGCAEFMSLMDLKDTLSGYILNDILRSIRDEKPLHYTLQIQPFSLLKTALATCSRERYESPIFNVGGFKWKLALYPNGDKNRNGSGYISLYLVTAEDEIVSATSEVNVVLTFLVYDNLRDNYLAVLDGKVRRFHAMKTEWGFGKLVSLETFNDSSNGFLVDDCCAFGVDIFVMKLESYRWKIRLHPKGCSQESAGFLSLYLIFDSFKELLPQGCRVYAEFEIAVLSKYGVGHKKLESKCWFEFGGIETGLGFPEFMPLRDLKEVKKGYICDDTLIVKVKINVVSILKKLF